MISNAKGNTGYYNAGNRNTGDGNLGDWNAGNWNSCNFETGFFNTEQPETVRVFNKPCLMSEWIEAEKPEFLYFKLDKELGYKGSFKKAFESATAEDIKILKALPNFDADVFFEISGIRIDV